MARERKIMADIFDFWRLMWPIANVWSPTPALFEGELAHMGESPASPAGDVLANLASIRSVRIELATLWLLERRQASAKPALPVLIVAPYALHDAAIADFAKGHSLIEILADAGLNWLALTYWKSARPEMRDFGIDAYLSDLNVAIDDLGGRVALVGLCQGGWLATAYAARFPAKVETLVVAGSPIDLAAGSSQITRSIEWTPPVVLQRLVDLGGGRVLGRVAQPFWAQNSGNEFIADEALQVEGDAEIRARFAAWNARTVDLPGRYFLQTAEWLFRENRLAEDRFPALGRDCKLKDIRCPIFVLAAADDEIVSAPQATAVARLCPNAEATVRIAPGKHLSLFMGRDTLAGAWREIAGWLRDHASATAAHRTPVRRRPLSSAAIKDQSPPASADEL